MARQRFYGFLLAVSLGGLLIASADLVAGRGIPPPVSVSVTVSPPADRTPPPVPPTAPPVISVVPTIAPTARPIRPIRGGPPRVVFVGDSLSTPDVGDAQVDNAHLYSTLVCQAMGWMRVNQPTTWNPATCPVDSAAYPGGTLLWTGPSQHSPVAIHNFKQRAGAYDPNVIVVYLGTNDFGWVTNGWGWSLDNWQAAWENLYQQIAALPTHPRVYVLGLQTIWFDTYRDPIVALGPDRAPLPREPGVGYSGWATDYHDAVAKMNATTAQEANRHGAIYVDIASGMDDAMFDPVQPNGQRNLHLNARGQQHVADRLLAAIS